MYVAGLHLALLLIVHFVLLYAERDWEDIRKMPEHATLLRDFNRLRPKWEANIITKSEQLHESTFVLQLFWV